MKEIEHLYFKKIEMGCFLSDSNDSPQFFKVVLTHSSRTDAKVISFPVYTSYEL